MPRSILVGAEATDLTAATTWRLMQYENDDHKSKNTDLSFRGIGAPGGAPSLSQFLQVPEGATNSLSLPLQSNGLGILNRAAGSTFSSDVVDGGTLAYEQITTFGATGTPADRSLSLCRLVDQADGDIDYYLSRGGVVTQVIVTVEVDKLVMISYELDWRVTTRPGSAPTGTGSPTIIVPDCVFPWSRVTATLTNLATDATSTDKLNKVVITIPTSVDTNDKAINASGVRQRPTRSGLPAPTVELGWKYQDPKFYDAYLGSVAFGLSLSMTGPVAIEDTTFPSFTVDVPAFVYDPNDPTLSVDDPTTQSMPAKVMYDGTNAPVTFTQVTSDDAP